MDCLDAAGGVFRRQRNGRMSVFVADSVEAPDLFSETVDAEDSVPPDVFPEEILAEDVLCDELFSESLEQSAESLFGLDLKTCADSDCGTGFDVDPELDGGIGTDGCGPSNRISPYADDA